MQFCHNENHCSMTLQQSCAKHVVACIINGDVSNSLLSFLDLSTVAYQRKDFHCWWLMIEDLSLVHRCCQNIERARAKVSQSQFTKYFSNPEKVLTNPDGSKVPPSNIFNYDETKCASTGHKAHRCTMSNLQCHRCKRNGHTAACRLQWLPCPRIINSYTGCEKI